MHKGPLIREDALGGSWFREQYQTPTGWVGRLLYTEGNRAERRGRWSAERRGKKFVG